MAATSQPLSTNVALDVLKAGGSAVDAAIAANAMEGVVEPMMNGMGGDLMAIVWDEESQSLHGLNSCGRAPVEGTSLADLRKLIDQATPGKTTIPSKGPLGVTVPGAVKGWCMLHERFGKLPWSKLFEGPIATAREGFPVTPVIASEWEVTDPTSPEVTSGGRFPNAADGFASTFLVEDATTGKRRPPRAGEIFRNPDLAASLQLVADGGCEAFYNGSIAAKIAAFAKQAGTRLEIDDFSRHTSEWVDPVNTTYRGRYRLFELPPNPQGIAAIQQLNILENFNLSKLAHNSADYLHLHIEAKKLAFADRAKYYADPNFVHVPVEGLISKSYAMNRSRLIEMSRAAEQVDAGTPSEHASLATGDTIYLTVADASGQMVSLIQSNYEGFGSGLVVPGTGFALQDRGALFSTITGSADVFAPGKRPFHTIIPGFVFRDEEPWLSFGVMGGNMQPQGHAQILSNLVDFGMNVQEAGDAARYYHTGSSQPTGSVMRDGGLVILEGGVCPAVRAELKSRGHHLIPGPNMGGYQAILRERVSADLGGGFVYQGASEMRKDGMAAGW